MEVHAVEWGNEAARDLQIADFWDVLTLVLSRIELDVWLSLVHDSTSAQVMLRRFWQELVARGLGPMGEIAIPRAVWEGYVPAFSSAATGRHSPAVPPSLEEGRVMLRAPRSQGLLYPLPPQSPGPIASVFPFFPSLQKAPLLLTSSR